MVINQRFILVFLCYIICFSCNMHENSTINSDVIVDSVLFESGFTELSPIIEKYSCKFHYENGTFGLSLPFVGCFFRIDSLGNTEELTSNYSISDLKSPSLNMKGVSFNGDLFDGQFYSYYFSKVDEIRVLDLHTGDLVKIPSNIRGSVLHSDVYKVSDRILFSRYGKLDDSLVFHILEIKDSKTSLLYSIELEKPLSSFPPFLTSYNSDDFYFLKQGSDSLYTVNLNKGGSKFYKKLQVIDKLSKAFLFNSSPDKIDKITYTEFRVFNDTVYTVSNRILIDSIDKKNINRILTIESNDYFKLVDLPETFLGLGPYFNYFSLENSNSQRFIFLRPLRDLYK